MRNGSKSRRFTEPQASHQDPAPAKTAWRQSLRLLVPDEPRSASTLIVEHLRGTLQPDDVVLLFWPMTGEPDLRPLVDQGDVSFALTRTPPEGQLTVHVWSAPREVHRWGFEQPASSAPEVSPNSVTVALVPGVGFGRDGSRLGHGKGYYDDLLARMPAARRIGVTWSCRVVDALPVEPHDVRMHELVTEDGWLTVG